MIFPRAVFLFRCRARAAKQHSLFRALRGAGVLPGAAAVQLPQLPGQPPALRPQDPALRRPLPLQEGSRLPLFHRS